MIIIKTFTEFINESNNNDSSEFIEALDNLNTLDLEDDEVRYPQFDEDTDDYIFQVPNENCYVHIRKREELPQAGSFELFLLNIDDEVIGFIRGNKSETEISFNLIYIIEDERGKGLGLAIYEYFINNGYTIKSDTEITDSTYSLYVKLAKKYKTIVYNDGRVGIKK